MLKKALETRISFHRGSFQNHGEGPFTGSSDIWRSLETDHLSLWEFCEGNLEGGLFTRDPEGYVEEGYEDGHLSPHEHL